jgi:hypothetical protein
MDEKLKLGYRGDKGKRFDEDIFENTLKGLLYSREIGGFVN